ncbi:hypothetical protein [Methylomagnum sp.]
MAHKQKGISAVANTYLDANELVGYRLGLYIVNSGMEPTTLRSVLIDTYDGQMFRHRLRDDGGNQIRLAQSEFYECFLTQANSDIAAWAKHKIKSVKVVDSYGEGWEVKDFADIINQRHHAGMRFSDFLWGDFIGQVKSALTRHDGGKPGGPKPGTAST